MRRHRERRERAGADVGKEDGNVERDQLNLAAQKVGDRRRRAAIGHVHEIDMRLGLQQLDRHMGDAAGARGAEVELPRIGAGIVDQVLESRHLERGMHRQHFRHPRHQREQGEVLLPVERHLAHHERHDGERARAGEPDGVSVGRAARDHVDPGHPAHAGPVLHHDLLAEAFGELDAEDAREQVGRPAGGKRHDQPDRPRGIVLRGGRERPQQRRPEQHQARNASVHHSSP